MSPKCSWVIPTFDFYKKSPDLNYYRAQYKTTKISICVTLFLVIILILINFRSISNIWIPQISLTKTSQAQILPIQTLDPFLVGIFLKSGCVNDDIKSFYSLYYPKFCTYYSKVKCSQGILNQFQITNSDQCFICFQVDELDVQNFWNQAFRVQYHPYLEQDQYKTENGYPLTYNLIIQRQGYDQINNNILQNYEYEIIQNIITDSSIPTLCRAYQIFIDNSLFDWSKQQSIGFIGNCVRSDWNSQSTSGVVVSNVKTIRFQRRKISLIISDIVSFSFITVLIAMFFTNYNKMVMNFQRIKEISNEELLNKQEISYLDFILIKIFKNDKFRRYCESRKILPQLLKKFYALRKINHYLSIQNIIPSLHQKIIDQDNQNSQSFIKKSQNQILQSEHLQQQQQYNKSVNLFLTILKLSIDPAISTHNNILHKPQKVKQIKSSFISKILQNIDFFSAGIQFQEQQQNATSCFSIIFSLISIFGIFLLAYYSNFFNSFNSATPSQFLVAKQNTQFLLTQDKFNFYIVVMDMQNELNGIPLFNVDAFIQFSVNLIQYNKSTKVNYKRNCTVPNGFIYPYSKTIQYCLASNFSIRSKFGNPQKYLNISIKATNSIKKNIRIMIVQNYYTFQQNFAVMKWAKMQYQIPQFYKTTQKAIQTQNIWITYGIAYTFTLFSQIQTDEAFFIKNIFQKATQDSQLQKIGQSFRLDILFMASVQEYHLITYKQQIFDLIIDFLGISYISLLLITKCCNNYYNKQKSLRRMSKRLKLLDHQSDMDVLYQCCLCGGAVKQLDLEGEHKDTNIKQAEINMLDMSNILKLINRLEYSYPRKMKYIKQLIEDKDYEDDQNEQQNDNSENKNQSQQGEIKKKNQQ